MLSNKKNMHVKPFTLDEISEMIEKRDVSSSRAVKQEDLDAFNKLGSLIVKCINLGESDKAEQFLNLFNEKINAYYKVENHNVNVLHKRIKVVLISVDGSELTKEDNALINKMTKITNEQLENLELTK